MSTLKLGKLEFDVGQHSPIVILGCIQVIHIFFAASPERRNEMEEESYFVGDVMICSFANAQELNQYLGYSCMNVQNLSDGDLGNLTKVFLLSI